MLSDSEIEDYRGRLNTSVGGWSDSYVAHLLDVIEEARADLAMLLEQKPIGYHHHSRDSPGHASYRTWTLVYCRSCKSKDVEAWTKIEHKSDCPWFLLKQKYEPEEGK